MEGGSRLDRENKDVRTKGEKMGSVLEPNIEPFVPKRGHDPGELRSWAKRTGFVSTFSGESQRSVSWRRGLNEGRNDGNDRFDLEKGILGKNESISPKIEIDPILGRTRRRGAEIESDWGVASGKDKNGVLGFRDGENETRRNGAVEANLGKTNIGRLNEVTENENDVVNGNGHGVGANVPVVEQKIGDGDSGGGVDANVYHDGEDSGDGGWRSSPKMICGVKDNPGYG